MTAYALLPQAAANRVYGATSIELTRAELALVARLAFGGLAIDGEVATLGGVDYVLFDYGERSLDAFEVAVISNLSSLHALFAREGDRLAPVTVTRRAVHDDDITTIQRYSGKTNELFTRLLVNVTLAAAHDGFRRLLAGERVRLLDPVCGRGTTLNQAVVYGLDACGIEHDKRDVEAYAQFLVTWLKDKRIKHSSRRERLRRGRATPASRLHVTYGAEVEDQRRRIEVVNDDTLNAADHVKARSIDVIVGDLPYGIQHATAPGGGRLSRSPAELLAGALPVWRRALRAHGAIGLAWNLRTLERSRMLALLRGAGFQPCVDERDSSFAHRVDRSITRDLVVARRGPGG